MASLRGVSSALSTPCREQLLYTLLPYHKESIQQQLVLPSFKWSWYLVWSIMCCTDLIESPASYSFCLAEATHLCLGHSMSTSRSNHFDQGELDDVEQTRFEPIIAEEITRFEYVLEYGLHSLERLWLSRVSPVAQPIFDNRLIFPFRWDIKIRWYVLHVASRVRLCNSYRLLPWPRLVLNRAGVTLDDSTRHGFGSPRDCMPPIHTFLKTTGPSPCWVLLRVLTMPSRTTCSTRPRPQCLGAARALDRWAPWPGQNLLHAWYGCCRG